MRNKVSVAFCIIGGILMIIASVVGNALAYRMLVDFAVQSFPAYKTYLMIFLTICIYVALGGGISVIVGTILTFKMLKIGKWIIGLGAGMGLIGFISWLVTGIIAGTITALNQENYAVAVIAGGIGLPFYVGNIYGSANAAKKWNLGVRKEVRNKIYVTLDFSF